MVLAAVSKRSENPGDAKDREDDKTHPHCMGKAALVSCCDLDLADQRSK